MNENSNITTKREHRLSLFNRNFIINTKKIIHLLLKLYYYYLIKSFRHLPINKATKKQRQLRSDDSYHWGRYKVRGREYGVDNRHATREVWDACVKGGIWINNDHQSVNNITISFCFKVNEIGYYFFLIYRMGSKGQL